MAPLQFSVVQRTTELLPFSWLWLNANSEKCTIKKKRNFKSWGKSLMVLKPRPNPTTIDTSCRRPLFTFFFFFPYICTFFLVYLLASLQIFPSEPTACWKTSSPSCFASPFPWWKTQVSKSPLASQEQVCGSNPSGPLLSCRGDLDVGAQVLLTTFNQAYRRDANSKQT